MPSADGFTFSEHEGLIEPMVDLGERVRTGDVLARVYPVDRTGASPIEFQARLGGSLAARHFPGRVQSGDRVAVVGTVDEIG